MMSSVLFLFDILLSNMFLSPHPIWPFPVLIDKFDCSHFVSCNYSFIHAGPASSVACWLLLQTARGTGLTQRLKVVSLATGQRVAISCGCLLCAVCCVRVVLGLGIDGWAGSHICGSQCGLFFSSPGVVFSFCLRRQQQHNLSVPSRKIV